MKRPVARPTKPVDQKPQSIPQEARTPRAFAPPEERSAIDSMSDLPTDLPLVTPSRRRRPWMWHLFLGLSGILVSLGLYLLAETLVRALFARYEWLGWGATGVLALLIGVVFILAVTEIRAIWRLQRLEELRKDAAAGLVSDDPNEARQLLAKLQTLYADRPELARPRKTLDHDSNGIMDGRDLIRAAERNLMKPLDMRARQLTSAAARRVALVTAISPRALVDVAFVAYESIKLARAIAELYGARPGLIGSWRLFGSVLGHLAVTGGVALGDSVIQQVLGHGLAAKLSARLGEGLVNGLMTARVGIAAMRVTRPLPFEALKQPVVMDFAADLARLQTADTDRNV